MTQDLNTFDDWSKVQDEDWDKLVNMQRMEDNEIDQIFDELF